MAKLLEKVRKMPEKVSSNYWEVGVAKDVMEEINSLVDLVNAKDPQVISRVPTIAALHAFLVSEGVVTVSITSFRDYLRRRANASRKNKPSSRGGKT